MPPNDATWDALQRLAEDGSDLSRPLQMDFFVAVPTEASGNAMALRAASLGFTTSVERDAETREWTCYCTKTLIPEYHVVVGIEKDLDDLARAVGGHADGFGSYGNADSDDDAS